MTCIRHPHVQSHDGHCAACLLEMAVAAWPRASAEDLTLLVPLGASEDATVYLAREGPPGGGLVRLKAWRAPSSDACLARVLGLRERLAGLALAAVPSPRDADLDAGGRLITVDEFRQGMPITAACLTAGRVRALARTLAETLDTLHAAGFVHGAIHGGNVLVQPETGAVTLLDTGMRQALGAPPPSRDDDHRALARLLSGLRGNES